MCLTLWVKRENGEAYGDELGGRARATRAYAGDAYACARFGTMIAESAGIGASAMRTMAEMCANDVNAVRIGRGRKTNEIVEETSEEASEALRATVARGELSIEIWFDSDDQAMQGSEFEVPIFRIEIDGSEDNDEAVVTVSRASNGWVMFKANWVREKFDFGHGSTHFIASIDRDGGVLFYLNGKFVRRGTATVILATDTLDAGLRVHIGGHSSETTDAWWIGDVYVVAVYPTALDDADVAAIHAVGLASNPPQPWPRTIDYDASQDESAEIMCGVRDIDVEGDIKSGTQDMFIELTRLPQKGKVREVNSRVDIMAVPHRLPAGNLSFTYAPPANAWSKRSASDDAEAFDVIEFVPVDSNGTRAVFAGVINIHVIAKVIALNAGGGNFMMQTAVFGVSGQIAINSNQLDDWCDADENTCDLNVDSKLVLRQEPAYGILHECMSGQRRRVGDVILASDMCYNATDSRAWDVENLRSEDIAKYNDSVQFQVADVLQSPRFRFSLDVYKGILACDSSLTMTEDKVTTITLQAIDTDRASDELEFIIEQNPNFMALFFEDGRRMPVGEAIQGQSCGIRPTCSPYSILQAAHRACLNVVVVPFVDYFNAREGYQGPESPPWPLDVSHLTYISKCGKRSSKQATITIEVANEIDAIYLTVNRTVFQSKYLERAVLGTFYVYASDFDAYALRVDIHSERANLLAISNLTALALCENPFITGDGTGSTTLSFKAVPSVIRLILNSLVYINIGQALTQDEIRIHVGNAKVTLIALLDPKLKQ